MLWLIWIAIMLLTPVFAGIGVWRQIEEETPAPGAGGAGGERCQDS